MNRGIPVYILFTSAVLNYSEESARTLCPSEAGEAGQGESQGIPVLRGAVAAFLETSLTMTRTFGKGSPETENGAEAWTAEVPPEM